MAWKREFGWQKLGIARVGKVCGLLVMALASPIINKTKRSSIMIDITRDKFLEYEKIRKEGRYNMFDPQARALSSLDRNEWVTIMTDYEKLANAWLKSEDNNGK